MRATWTGMLSFGMVNIPLRMYLATEDKGVKFNQLHRGCDHGRIRQKRVCEQCGEVVTDMGDIVRGFEVVKATKTVQAQYVVMEDADFEGLHLGPVKSVAVERFVKESEVGFEYLDKLYYLEPDKTGSHGFSLIREAMKATKMVALARITFRSEKEHLAMVRVTDVGLSLHTLRWPDEIRPPVEAPLEKAKPEELKMAKLLISNLAGSFTPEELRDEYREGLVERIEAKADGQEIVVAAPTPEQAGGDFFASLKASVEAVKKEAV